MTLFRMPLFFQALSVIGLVLIGTSSLNAQGGQDRGRRGFGDDSGLRLLSSEQVQQELDLVEDQVEQLDELQSRQRDEMREMFMGMRGRFRDMDREDRQTAVDDMREEMTKLNEKFSVEAKEVLLPHQVTRWEQLKFQSRARQAGGADRFMASDGIAEKLNITKEQLEAMKAKAEEIRVSVEEKIAAIRAEAQEELLSVLTPEQQEQYKSLAGESFAFENNRQGGRGDRGPGGRGDRGEGGRGGDRVAGGRGDRGPGGRGDRGEGGRDQRPDSDL